MKLHWSLDGDVTLCGRLVSTVRLAPALDGITCIRCKSHPVLDGELGNMTHTGH